MDNNAKYEKTYGEGWGYSGPAVWHCGKWHPIAEVPFVTPCCGVTLFEEIGDMPKRADYVVYLRDGQPLAIVRDIPRGEKQFGAIMDQLRQAGIPIPPLTDRPLRWKPKSKASKADWLRAQGR